jgi:molybdopterin molybdotransferase
MRILSATEAANEIVAAVAVQPSLRVPLADARGHVLAEDVFASIPLPPWTNSAMDGYAVRGDDVRGATPEAPMQLRVVDAVRAGEFPRRSLGTGEAVRVFTGAPVPLGADTVVRQEDTDRGMTMVAIHRDRDAGANVRLSGADLAHGALALGAGASLGAHQLAVLAALGVAHPMVHRLPRIAVLATGDEIVSIDHPEDILAARKLADVNGPVLAALVHEAGGVAVSLGIVRDDPAELQERLNASDDFDMLITVGGVSVGDHDHVRDALAARGARTRFDRVRVRPGGPTVFGLLPDRRPWLGLPGNPVSAMVTFELFGRPAIRAMAGHRDPFRVVLRAILGADAKQDATLDQFVRCTFSPSAREGLPMARLTGPQGSGMLMSIVHADGLAIIPAGNATIPAGSMVDALRFG